MTGSPAAAYGIGPVSVRPNRPRVLVSLAAYLPGFRTGGPVRTIANLVDQLSSEFDFHIVAADRDSGDTEPYEGVVTDRWTTHGKASVFYRSPGAAGWRALISSLQSTSFDLVYLNSFFDTASLRLLVYRRLGWIAVRPILLAPRGEFSAGAMSLKALKKRLFIALAQTVRLYRGVVFQASSPLEAGDIQCVLGPTDVVVAGNPTGRSSNAGAGPPDRQPNEPLRVVFLSRISPKKNLTGALDILARVSCPIRFDIYGVIEDAGYWSRCLERMASLPSHVAAQYRGEVMPERVEELLSGNDLFFFPTLGENYGHVIREALSSGLPVLISDQTPWQNLGEVNAGAGLPLGHPDGFVAWIDAFSQISSEQLAAMRLSARKHGDDREIAIRNLDANRTMLYAAIGNGGVKAWNRKSSHV